MTFFCGNKCIDNNNQIIQSRWIWILFIVIIAIDALNGFHSNWGTFFLDCGNQFFWMPHFFVIFSESLLPFTCVYGTMIKYIHVSISSIERTHMCVYVCIWVCIWVCVWVSVWVCVWEREGVKEESTFKARLRLMVLQSNPDSDFLYTKYHKDRLNN